MLTVIAVQKYRMHSNILKEWSSTEQDATAEEGLS